MIKRAKVIKEKASEPDHSIRKIPERLIEPGILLLLKEKPSHGYDMLGKLAAAEISGDNIDAGTVYRTLRGMEKEGLIKSKWLTEGAGPAKRVYEVTPKAIEAVSYWVDEVERKIGLLKGFSKRLKQFAPD